MLGQSEVIKDFQYRFTLVLLFIGAAFALLSLRLVYLQLIKGSEYRRFSEQNSLRREKIQGPRGQILDRDGRVLVDNRLQLNVTVTPQFLKEPEKTLALLAQLAGEDGQRMFQSYRSKSRGAPRFQPINMIESAPWETIVKIESRKVDLPGVEVQTRILRSYLEKEAGAQLFGYLSEVTERDLARQKQKGNASLVASGGYELGDLTGRAGIEQRWETELRGRDGVRFVEVNAHGHRVRGSQDDEASFLKELPDQIEPKPGRDLVLTIDRDLQRAAAAGMTGKLGSVVALDPRTGEVLAMLSNPSVDPTELSTQPELWPSVFKNSYGPLRNKAIQDHFPAGSTFKTFTLLAALENGIMDPTTTVFCPGFYRFGNRTYHCHKKEGHGIVDALGSLKGSCDVYYYTIASRLGIDSISKVASDFGFGRRTGIQLRNEVPGLMPTEAWKQSQLGQVWTPGETLSAAIGQGYNLVTPLQLAVAHATLVNGGNLYRPYVVSQVRSAEGRVIQSFKPEVISNHKIEPKFLELIKEALFSVSNDPRGTAYATTHTPEELISGKTGTVQVRSMTKDELFRPCVNLPFDERHHAWFVGYAPRDNPEIVVSVLGMHECSGSRGAAPVARKVIDAWWEKKQRVEGIHGPRPAVR